MFKLTCWVTYILIALFVFSGAFYKKGPTDEELKGILSQTLAANHLDHTREGVQYIVDPETRTITIVNKKKNE